MTLEIDIDEVIGLKNEISTLISFFSENKIESLNENAADEAQKKQLVEFGFNISEKLGKIEDLIKEENIDTLALDQTFLDIQEMLGQSILDDLNIILYKFEQLKSMLSPLNQFISMTP